MSRVNRSLVLVAFVSFCFGKSLLAQAPHNAGAHEPQFLSGQNEQTQQCTQLREQYARLTTQEAAKELYKKAFLLSFDQKWEAAEVTSQCASLLFNGETHWRVEAKNLIK